MKIQLLYILANIQYFQSFYLESILPRLVISFKKLNIVIFLKAVFILMTFQLSPWLSLKLIRFAWVVLSLKGKSAVTFLFFKFCSQPGERTQRGTVGELALCCHLVSAGEIDVERSWGS